MIGQDVYGQELNTVALLKDQMYLQVNFPRDGMVTDGHRWLLSVPVFHSVKTHTLYYTMHACPWFLWIFESQKEQLLFHRGWMNSCK